MSEVNGAKALRAADLQRLLSEMAPGWHVQPNNIGSLSVFDRHPGEPGAALLGYIDFQTGVFGLFV